LLAQEKQWLRDLDIVLPKHQFVAGEKIYGYVKFECDDAFDCNGIHVTLYAKERTYFSKGSGDNRRTYKEERFFIEERVILSEAGSIQSGLHRFDFSFSLPNDIPSSYGGYGGNIDYYMEAKAEISWALDPSARMPIGVIAPMPQGYEAGARTGHEYEGIEILAVETDTSSFCIGGEMKFKFRISREANIRGVRMELVHNEIASARGRTDTTNSVKVQDYFPEEQVRREDWLSVKLGTNPGIPPTFRSALIVSVIVLKVTLDIPWRFDKSVEIPLVAGYCVSPPEEEDSLFGDF
jgi:hypothetical protein